MASVVNIYARAFADVVLEKRLDPAKTLAEAQQMSSLVRENKALREVWQAPSVSADQKRAVLDAIRVIVQNLRESSRWAEKYLGMSGAQLFVLQKLDEAPAQSVNGLAARTHTHQSSVSAIVARLVERGLVTRARSKQDGRTIELMLSPLGRRVVSRAPDAAQERLIRAIEQLSPARRRSLASALSALGRAVGTTDRQPTMFFEDRHAGRRRNLPHA
jgi:DNA-binding MarR family transcriptional regulator